MASREGDAVASILTGHMSAQRIEADLKACTDSFVNLVRAARIGDESAASKKSKVTLPIPW